MAVISVLIYTRRLPDQMEIVWVGTSLDDLREFPKDARQDTGFQLEQVALGRDPDHWKPMPAVGAGCREIRISTGDGFFRVFYVTQFGDEIYVLHCFTKKTQTTSKKDIDTGERRYKLAKRMHEQRKGRTP